MLRHTLVVIAVYILFCAMARGQNTEPAQAGRENRPPATGHGTRERPALGPSPTAETEGTPSALRRAEGSLVRASAGAPPAASPGRTALRTYSAFAVPEPQPKMVRKHDLVTIVIREESETSNQGTSDLKRNSDVEARIDEFVRLNVGNVAVYPGVTGTPPGIKLTGSRNFKGEATVDRTDSFIARITAEVVDVKPNGTLVLQARKKIRNDEEEQTYVCSGICRVDDVTPDNTVLSTQLFDLEVSKTTKGQVRSTTRTGVIGKLLDFLNLF